LIVVALAAAMLVTEALPLLRRSGELYPHFKAYELTGNCLMRLGDRRHHENAQSVCCDDSARRARHVRRNGDLDS
jgi:hypothetical protein